MNIAISIDTLCQVRWLTYFYLFMCHIYYICINLLNRDIHNYGKRHSHIISVLIAQIKSVFDEGVVVIIKFPIV